MIRLVTFDLYQTLCHAVPDRYERLADVCRELGFASCPDDFVRPDVEAEELYTVENGRRPMHLRPPEEQTAFYRAAMQIRLRGAGLPHDEDTAERVRAAMELRRAVEWRLFDDVDPTFAALRERGLEIGVISNTPIDATILCTELGVCERVDFVVSSCLVGCEKPCRPIFQAALDQAGVPAEAAVHVGDQPRSDAVGAVGAGMHTLLLDRRGLLEHETAYERIRSLGEVVAWLDGRPGRACLIA
ncbi:MAG TPA: HAD family hydrolase [Chloroflexota bacterium]|nr:HAD family hydrolase [Chloroflexota bacterium]